MAAHRDDLSDRDSHLAKSAASREHREHEAAKGEPARIRRGVQRTERNAVVKRAPCKTANAEYVVIRKGSFSPVGVITS